ncbi:hypothetical protein ACP70R_018357 [Stipagrostis hirtigluma subsp. patula]
MEPSGIKFLSAREITNNFSKKQIIGRGPHGDVYRGVNSDGTEIAVKKLHVKPGFDAMLVQEELRDFRMPRHRNIVHFMGYFCETKTVPQVKNGIPMLVRKTSIALRFEYAHNGCLQKHLSDEFSGLDWHTRFQIILGICHALEFIHSLGIESTYHWVLKPDKILLDETMVPKLADVGLSKVFGEDLTKITDNSYGTLKYCPPEFIEGGVVSDKFDVFSLGVVMLEIVAGPMGHTKTADMSPGEFVDLTAKNWRKRLQETWSGSQLETYCEQVKRCTEIAFSCVEVDRHKRPDLMELREMLHWVKRKHHIDQMEVDSGYKAAESVQGLFQEIVSKSSTSRLDDISIELDALERTIEGSEKPTNLKLHLLQLITKNFSDELKIGHGGCGVVYRIKQGILPNGFVAVKRLFNSQTIEDRMFHQEVKSMLMFTHQNTVQLLGYCSHTEEQAIDMGGKIIMAQIRERLLCFEYVSNGSLANHLTDELRGLEWHTRYQIIKGVCEGLHHLHKEKHIIHMDLKPANILLDDHMVPKITDFGLSRLDDKSQTMNAQRLLSLGYCAPEYLHYGKMSAKSDIYSLGVIILELVTGSKEKPSSITNVLRRWKHRWHKSVTGTPLGYKQVVKCLDLARRCTHTDPTDRPNIWDIISDLNKMDTTDEHISDAIGGCHELNDMLGIEPLEMHLLVEHNKQISCSIELTNDSDDYFAFRISTTSLRPYCIHPNKDTVPPRSKSSVTITLEAPEKAPQHIPCRDEFSVQSTRVDGSLTTKDITGDMFNEELNKVVDKVNLMVVLDFPPIP